MKIFIKDINIGDMDEETEFIFNFDIIGQLKSGKEINIFDLEKYDLRNYEDEIVDCLIGVGIEENTIFRSKNDIDLSNPSIIFGKFIKQYQVPSKWKNHRTLSGVGALENEDGTFLFDFDSIKNVVTNDDKYFGLKVIRYDLLDFIDNEK